MDDYNGSIKPINDSNEENPDLNSAPIPSESEIKNNTPIPNVNYTNEQYYNINNNNIHYNQEDVIYPEYIERPIIEQNNEVGDCRKVFQYIFVVILYICTIFGIVLQIIYGINIALIDDALICSLASIMLFFTLKNKSTNILPLGLYTIAITIGGFLIRGYSFNYISGKVLLAVGYFMARNFILMFCISVNCNKKDK